MPFFREGEAWEDSMNCIEFVWSNLDACMLSPADCHCDVLNNLSGTIWGKLGGKICSLIRSNFPRIRRPWTSLDNKMGTSIDFVLNETFTKAVPS